MSGSGSQRNALEWAVFGIGALLVVALIGYLVLQATAGPGEPARVEIELDPEAALPNQVRLLVRNEGDQTAETVRVEVCAAGGSPCATLTFPYLPPRSERRGTVGFRAPPARPLEARVVSYRDP